MREPVSDDVMGSEELLLGSLTEEQRDLVKEATAYYIEEGGVLDDFGHVTILRFLSWHEWKLLPAKKMMKATATWRRKVGADDVREKLRNGGCFSDFDKALELMQVP